MLHSCINQAIWFMQFCNWPHWDHHNQPTSLLQSVTCFSDSPPLSISSHCSDHLLVLLLWIPFCNTVPLWQAAGNTCKKPASSEPLTRSHLQRIYALLSRSPHSPSAVWATHLLPLHASFLWFCISELITHLFPHTGFPCLLLLQTVQNELFSLTSSMWQ